MRKLLWVVPAAFFFLNPGLACEPAEPSFQYGAAELRAAVEGDWTLSITPTGGAAETYGVHLAQADTAPTAAAARPSRGLVRAAHACGTRTLVASADACVEITEMPLTVTLAPGGPPTSGTPTGRYRVIGLAFTTGDLDLVIGAYHVTVQVKADGTVSSASLTPGGPSGGVVATRS